MSLLCGLFTGVKQGLRPSWRANIWVSFYPADIRQMIADGKITATVNQDPYPHPITRWKWPITI